MNKRELFQYVRSASPVTLEGARECPDCVEVRVDAKDLLSFMRFLKTNDVLAFDLISDVTAVDHYTSRKPRFDVVYHIFSLKNSQRIRVKVAVDEGESVVSVTSVWRGAEWLEREVYDMFGIWFDDHPDMRRILMPEDYKYFPLRKDFPLEGIED
ncbi:MAG: NADH-quinone oxidoreductase subunit C [Deltaproteobacteria bacterium]|nr:NADH-quinone oxidoreductase subunit C [Deltaproteobacteria bacterium]MBW2067876.1 NADH-quinone oxidoreductase subunit C [Deltaproteobacteria bacterium]